MAVSGSEKRHIVDATNQNTMVNLCSIQQLRKRRKMCVSYPVPKFGLVSGLFFFSGEVVRLETLKTSGNPACKTPIQLPGIKLET